jgi:branched-chain amino acid aminotransferase
MRYINYNGNIYPEHEQLLPVTNRGFRYGDGFFESMVMFGKIVPLLNYHWSRIELSAKLIFAELPKRFHLESFINMVLDLASVNDSLTNARIRLQFYRKGDGMYLPENNELGFVISMLPLQNTKFETGNGLLVGMNEDCYKATSMTSDLKTTSALMNVLAARYAQAQGWDECILLNSIENISEAITANIFLVKGHKLITPDLNSGCVDGVMRNYLLDLLGPQAEEREVSVKELLEADEILLTNAVQGVQWVREFENKIYVNRKATELTTLLNSELLGVG